MPLVYVPNSGLSTYGAPDGFIEIVQPLSYTVTGSSFFPSVYFDPISGMPQIGGGFLQAQTTKLSSLSAPFSWVAGVSMPSGVSGLPTSMSVASQIHGTRNWRWVGGRDTTNGDSARTYNFDGTTFNFEGNAATTLSETATAALFRGGSWGTASIGGFHPSGTDADKIQWCNGGSGVVLSPVMPTKRIDPLATSISKGTYAGSVYVLGGDVSSSISAAAYRRESNDTWTTLNNFPIAGGIWNQGQVELDNGKILIIAGSTAPAASGSDYILNNYIYTPDTDSYVSTNVADVAAETRALGGGRTNSYAVRLPDSGRIFILTGNRNRLISIPKTRRAYENFQTTTVGTFPSTMTWTTPTGGITQTVQDDTQSGQPNICIRSKVLYLDSASANNRGFAVLNAVVPNTAYTQCKLYLRSAATNSKFGILVRWTDSNNHIRVFAQVTANTLVIEQVASGVTSTVNSASVTGNVNPSGVPFKYHITVEFSGNTVTAKLYDGGSSGNGLPTLKATASGVTTVTGGTNIGVYFDTGSGSPTQAIYDELYAEW
jgi:hypothetical protein